MSAGNSTLSSHVVEHRLDKLWRVLIPMNRVALADKFLLAAAFLSFLASVGLWFSGLRDEGLYVGLWVPSILAFGGYVKHMTGRL